MQEKSIRVQSIEQIHANRIWLCRHSIEDEHEDEHEEKSALTLPPPGEGILIGRLGGFDHVRPMTASQLFCRVFLRRRVLMILNGRN